jgi:hypothetical protein
VFIFFAAIGMLSPHLSSYLTPEEFEQASEATGSDGADGSLGNPFRISTLPRLGDCSSINETKTGRSVTN